MSAPLRVAIVDDHPIVREGLVSILARRGGMDVVGEAGDGAGAVDLVLAARPDVTLIDLRMPGVGGVEAISRVRASWPEARFVVLTTFDTDEDVYRAIQAGARAYLLKDAPAEELVDTIRAVHRGLRRIPPEIAAKLVERVTSADLTEREVDVLRRVALGQSNREVGEALGITEGTVKTHVTHILEKLGARDRTQAVRIALQRGIVDLG